MFFCDFERLVETEGSIDDHRSFDICVKAGGSLLTTDNVRGGLVIGPTKS